MELSVESPCHHVKWKVQDFFQLHSLNSPKFNVADDLYCLRLYTNAIQLKCKHPDGAYIEISLVRLTARYPERNVSWKIGYRRKNGKGVEFDAHYSSSKLKKFRYKRSIFEANRDTWVPGNTLTVLCSIILRKQSSGESPQSEEAKTTDAEEEQEGLPEQSVAFSSRWRHSKMELSIESPCQHITWKVPNFFQLISKIGYSLNSPVFRFADDTYCLRFYPKGDRNGDTDDFELQLVRLTATFPERIVLYKVGYRDKPEKGSEYDEYYYSGTLTDELGFCLSRSQLEEERDEYVPDGTLTVVCFMRLGAQSSTGSRQSEEVGISDAKEKQKGFPGVGELQSHYRSLLQKGADSDACLVVSGREFRAHRLILRARSAVFDAMFGHKMSEKESGRVVINDLDPDIFEEFLEYLYTGGVGASLSDDNAFWLYAAADKYDVPSLKSECLAHLRRTLSVDSFCDVMTLALRHRDEDLLQRSIQFFKKNMPRIIVTAKWKQFVTDNGAIANDLLIKAFVPREQ